jgi:hypothetical protein
MPGCTSCGETWRHWPSANESEMGGAGLDIGFAKHLIQTLCLKRGNGRRGDGGSRLPGAQSNSNMRQHLQMNLQLRRVTCSMCTVIDTLPAVAIYRY